jgi:CDP-glycerol glycerophosphotransferase
MQRHPSISLIIPTYNVDQFLPTCIESIAMQSYIDIEVLIIDSCSTDRTIEIAKKYAKKYIFVHLFLVANEGISSARNFGVQHSKGDYILFIDADDILLDRNCLLHSLNEAKDKDADSVVFQYCLIDESGNIISPLNTERDFPNGKVTGITACKYLFSNRFSDYLWRVLIKRRIFLENKIQFPNGRQLAEDVAVSYKLYFGSRYVFFLPTVMYGYRKHSGQLTDSYPASKLLDKFSSLSESLKFTQEKFPQLRDFALARKCNEDVSLFRMSLTDRHNSDGENLRIKIISFYSLSDVFTIKDIRITTRIQLLLIKTNMLFLFIPIIEYIRKFRKRAK